MVFYPNGALQWTNRVNNTDIVWAADPNSLAAEISAIEQYVGTNPQTEKNPPLASMTTSFASMDARLSATARGDFLPYSVLNATYSGVGMSTPAGYKKFLSYGTTTSNDPYSMYNGTDLTLPCTGLWAIDANIDWDPSAAQQSGAQIMYFYLNGSAYLFDALEITPTLLSQCAEMWSDQLWNQKSFIKVMNAGTRIQIEAWNATNLNISIVSTTLSAVCLRQFPS